MDVISTEIPGAFIIEPKIIEDSRGWFCESFRADLFVDKIGDINFVQENESVSQRGVVRGLHYQIAPFAQAKLMRVGAGRIIDVAVDMREGSSTFGQHIAVELSAKNHRQLLIPRGFAHGFAVLEDNTLVQYKLDNYYAAEFERGVRFDDPDLGIDWGLSIEDMILSEKDKVQPLLKNAEVVIGC